MKTIALLLAATAVSVSPDQAAVGETVSVSGPAAREVVLEALGSVASTRELGTTGTDGTLVVQVPNVPPGDYRVVVAGEAEAPVLEVVALSRDTSLLLLGFGLLLVLGLVTAGVIVHRRWQDAIR